MDTIHKLVELQEIDAQLQEIEALLGDLPEKVANLKAEEKQLIASVEMGKTRLKEIEVQLGKNKLSIQSFQEDISKHKDQLSLVTTNRQYDAMMAEIDTLHSTLQELETQSLELMEEKSDLEASVGDQESNLATLSADLVERREKLEKRYADTAAEKESLESAREIKIAGIEERYLRQYKRIIDARDGVAVVPANDNACGGCGAVVPPQIVSEIRNNQSLHTCDVCGRFLFWKQG
ncbi:MAG: zinc ribbon domain-containing protein [Fidelibacterota bacterium]